MDFKAKIIEAAELGLVTLAHIEDGGCFESVADWLDYNPSKLDMEQVLVNAKLADWGASDVYEASYQAARQRARFASIKGA